MGDWQPDKVDTFTDTAEQHAHAVSVEDRRQDSPIDATYRARLAARRADVDAARAPRTRRSRGRGWRSSSLAVALVVALGRASAPWLAMPDRSPSSRCCSSTRACSTRAIARRARWRSTSAAWRGSKIAGRAPASAASASAIPTHLYADDLDLFGAGGLFELLATTRTTRRRGRVLAGWLLAPAARPTIRARQAARRRARAAARSARRPRGAGPGPRSRGPHRRPAGVGGRAAAAHRHAGRASCCRSSRRCRPASVVQWIWTGEPPDWLVPALAVQGLLGAVAFGTRAHHVAHGVEQREQELRVLATLMERIEREPVDEPAAARAARRGSTRPAARPPTRFGGWRGSSTS